MWQIEKDGNKLRCVVPSLFSPFPTVTSSSTVEMHFVVTTPPTASLSTLSKLIMECNIIVLEKVFEPIDL